jgi:hypothetical protein
MFAGIDPQAKIIQGYVVAANDLYVLQIYQCWFHEVSKALHHNEIFALLHTRIGAGMDKFYGWRKLAFRGAGILPAGFRFCATQQKTAGGTPAPQMLLTTRG